MLGTTVQYGSYFYNIAFLTVYSKWNGFVNGANSNHIKKRGVIMASTIRDVAARAGLSVGTVSKYINGKTVKESTRLAIE